MTAAPDPTTSPGSGASIVVLGSINVDVVARVERHPEPGETLHGTGGDLVPGGKGANQAVAAALTGGEVHMIGAVGSDPNAEVALGSLTDARVCVEAVTRVDGPTGLALVTVAKNGENSIVVIGGANDSVDAGAVERNTALLDSAGIVVAQGETPASSIRALAAAHPSRFVFNPAPVVDLPVEVFRAANPLVVNEHEARLVLDQFDASLAASLPRDPARYARALRAQGIPSLVLTLGAKGAMVFEGTDETSIPGVPVEVVDTTGAGDAFIGALCSRLSHGETLVDAARFAARVGAFAVTKHGAQPSYPRPGDTLPGASGETA